MGEQATTFNFVAGAVTRNTSITSLNVSSNHLHHDSAPALIDLIEYNKSITSIDLSDNDIFYMPIGFSKSKGRDLVEQFMAACSTNDALTSVDLVRNQLTPSDIEVILQSVRSDKSLHTVCVNPRSVKLQDYDALLVAHQLTTKRGLKRLFYGGRMHNSCMEDLAESIGRHTKLTALTFKGVGLNDDGCAAGGDAVTGGVTFSGHCRVEVIPRLYAYTLCPPSTNGVCRVSASVASGSTCTGV